MKFILSDIFNDSLAKLSPADQNIVKSAVFDLHTKPLTPGFNLEKLDFPAGPNLYSGRVNLDIRLIMQMDQDYLILLYVDHHDEAYRWASSHRCQHNTTTNSIEVIAVNTIEETEIIHSPVHLGPRIYQQFDSEYLLALGVPEEWLPAVRQATREDLEYLMGRLPPEVMDRLFQLEDGQLVPIPRTHEGDPVDHPDALQHFKTIEAKTDLDAALKYPWARWTVFLHPQQKDLVNASFSGPAKISGAAGTGKTILALHRAVRLARDHTDRKVLLTTFSRTLAYRIRQSASILCGSTEDIPDNLEIMHIHSLALRIWSEHHPSLNFNPVDGSEINQMLEQTMGLRVMGHFSPEFVNSEWKHVIDHHGIDNWDSYSEIPRMGRGTVLGQVQRRELWNTFGPVLEQLKETPGKMTWSQLVFSAARLMEDTSPKQYRHVVVDEIQDFGPAEIALIRNLVDRTTDDLFLCGDASQRIYQNFFSWSSSGIQIQGRSRRLSVNYRNTEEIRAFATAVLTGSSKGGDDEFESTISTTRLTGAKPVIKMCSDESDEIIALAEWIQDMLRSGYQQSDIAVFTRRTNSINSICAPALNLVPGAHRRDLRDNRPPSEEGISLGTMHGAKGLEFKAVALAGCGTQQIPDTDSMGSACDQMEQEEVLDQERNLLYVALTRPRERLLVTCNGDLSSLFPNDFPELYGV